MKKHLYFLFLACTLISFAQAQKVIPLYNGKAPGTDSWNWQENEYYHEMTKQRLVYNVVQPSLMVYEPPKGTANGTAVVIAPGGGFHILSIDNEGVNVAKWLNTKGITAFVLKYRLAHTVTNDPFMEMMQAINSPQKSDSTMSAIIPMSIADGMEAMKYVKAHAADFGVDPQRVGIMGFSAGGTVTTFVTTGYTVETRPAFAAPIYAYTGGKPLNVPADAPPMFIVAASDDNLKLAPHSVQLYSDWLAAGKPVEIHMYAKGGHGFGIRKQGLPTDGWIDRFGDWLELQGFMNPSKK